MLDIGFSANNEDLIMNKLGLNHHTWVPPGEYMKIWGGWSNQTRDVTIKDRDLTDLTD